MLALIDAPLAHLPLQPELDELRCSTGPSSVPCAGSLHVALINPDNQTAIEQRPWFNAAVVGDSHGLIASIQNFRAVNGRCDTVDAMPANDVCFVSNWSAFNSSWIAEHEAMRNKDLVDRAATLGRWASHMTLLHSFVRRKTTRGEFLLILEDGARLSPAFFRHLPSVLDRLPSDAPWHAVRFSTWSSVHEEDRLPETSIFRALHRDEDERRCAACKSN